MKKRAPVSKIMSSNPISVNLSNKVMDVANLFQEHNFHHIPVVSGSSLIGMISKSDIDRVSFVTSAQDEKANTAIYDSLKIEQVMTKQVDTVQVDDSIKSAAELLATGKYHALPVMDGKDLKGVVTSTDVIKYLLDQF